MIGKRRSILLGSGLVLMLTCVAGLGLRGRGDSTVSARPSGGEPTGQGKDRPPAISDREAYDPGLVDRTVAFWKARAERDPQGALELRELAGALLARHREVGEIADAVKAEDAARRSLAILPRNNDVALTRLARALLAQHRFPEALEVARFAAEYDPQALRLVADVLLELGDYDAAQRALADSPRGLDDPNFLAIRARLDAIDGSPKATLRSLEEARRLAEERPDLPAENIAWYRSMIGHALVDSGRLEEGEREFLGALEVFPRDYRAMTGLAETNAWRGKWKDAINWGEKAIALAPQNPDALRLVGDAHAALGRQSEADRHYRLLEALAHSFPRIYDRQWAMFCADNGRDLDEALALARKDLELRKDVHAYETLRLGLLQKRG